MQRAKRNRPYIRNGRYFITINGKLIRRSHFVWGKYHPEDPIKKGEVIHHINEDKLDDRIFNLQKMSNYAHRQIHSNVATKTLNRWRKNNIERAQVQGRNAIAILQQRMENDPEFAEWVFDRRRSGIEKAAKSRTGQKRSLKFKQDHSNRMKEMWSDPSTKEKILERRRVSIEKRKVGVIS